MGNKTSVTSCLIMAMVACNSAIAAPDEKSPATNDINKDGLNLDLVLLDAKKSDGSDGKTLGISFKFDKKYQFGNDVPRAFDPPDVEAGKEDVGYEVGRDAGRAVMKNGFANLKARGTLAEKRAKLGESLIDFSASGGYQRETFGSYVSAGGEVKYETDQERKNSQHVYGLVLSTSKVVTSGRMVGAGIGLDLGYATVDPKGDEDRKKLLGNLDSYRRWNGELTFLLPINAELFSAVEFYYRYYREVSPPPAVANAGMDRHKLWLIRLRILPGSAPQGLAPNGLYIDYASGSLPFDKKTDRAVKLGLNYVLK